MNTAEFAHRLLNTPATASACANTKLPHHEVVDISSDDESVDDGQPESSRRTINLSPSVKRVVNIDPDDDEPTTPLDFLYRMLESGRTKRQKLDHLDGIYDKDKQPIANRRTNATGPDESVLTPGWNLSSATQNSATRKGSGINEDATLAFRPVGNPAHPRRNQNFVRTAQPGRLHLTEIKKPKKSRAKLTAPPYYDDQKLQARMYCGSGYEKFPIVLGSDPAHQALCDRWDKLQPRKDVHNSQKRVVLAETVNYTDAVICGDSDDETSASTSDVDTSELECLSKIREVLPDIQREFALKQIEKYLQLVQCGTDDEVQVQPNPADIVSSILELSEYPKEETPKQIRNPASDGTGVTIEWEKGDTNNMTYQRDAVCLLAGQFEHIPTHFIFKTVHEKKSLFESYQYLHTLDMNYGTMQVKDRPYWRTHAPRKALEKKYTPKEDGLRSKVQWNNLVNELQAAKQQIERDALRDAKEQEVAAMEENNLQEHKACGNIIECQCCFDDEIPINRAVCCENTDMHWFCFSCTRRLAENQVGLMRFEMTCMHESGCKATLSRESIRLAISAQLIDKLDFYQQQAEITAAGIEGLEQCPFCEFKAICDPIEVDAVFRCQNPDCKHNSCRKCLNDSHVPKSCEEAKKDKQISARHRVEEARSEALIRMCPRCKVKIVKEIGCNKMQCVKCGCLMCYVCKSDISGRRDGGYGHFNEPGAKCILYDKNYDRHEVEVDEAEKAAIKKVQAENADIDEKQLRIETDAMKKKATPKKAEPGPALGRDRGIGHRPRLPIGDENLHELFRPRPGENDFLVDGILRYGQPLGRFAHVAPIGNFGMAGLLGQRGAGDLERGLPAGLPVVEGRGPENHQGHQHGNHVQIGGGVEHLVNGQGGLQRPNNPEGMAVDEVLNGFWALNGGHLAAMNYANRHTPPMQQLFQDPFQNDHAVLDNMYGPWNGVGQAALLPDLLNDNNGRQVLPLGVEGWLQGQRRIARVPDQGPADRIRDNGGGHGTFGRAHY